MIDAGSPIVEMWVWMMANADMVKAPPPHELLDAEVSIVRSDDPDSREQDTNQDREGGGG